MPQLAISVDHIAALRKSAQAPYPDPVAVAMMAELAGAESISAHLRADRAHTNDRDIRILRNVIQSELVLRMGATSETVGTALAIKPDRLILVAEKREEFSDEGGLDLVIHKSAIGEMVNTLQDGGLPVGIAVDPDPAQVKVVHQLNAGEVEIIAGGYSAAATAKRQQEALTRLQDATSLARKLKLRVTVRGGLDYQNIRPLLALLRADSYCVGYSLLARAVVVGIDRAVRDLKTLLNN
jgi:pyridoxine 5-phosphate synthase